MDWTLFVVLQVMFQPSLSDLFTVEAEQTIYKSDFGGDVVMGCRFQPKPSNLQAELKVTWHRINPTDVREVYRLDNGVEQPASPEYEGRVRLLTEELNEGWARLQVSKLRINDSGSYQCFVQTGEGADYKTITLSVIAPYKAVTKSIEKAAEGDKVLLTCESEGYPKTSVVWQDGHLQTLTPNTSAVSTSEHLFKVTSQIHVSSLNKNNYTCNFLNNGPSATFHIPDETPPADVKHDALIIVLSIGVVLAVITVGVLMYRRRKGLSSHSTKNLLFDGWSRPAPVAACSQENEENEEERTVFFSEHCKEENLRAFLKAHYCGFSLNTEARCSQVTFDVEELPHWLQNNEVQPVNLQDLLPEAGETLFLEGPPGSGKTTIADIFVTSWVEGQKHAVDLSNLQLLLYVDCSTVKSDLFHEILTQLSLKENLSTEDELRTMLTRSSDTLLLLDGYREGNKCFDESLKRFLSERGGCRVLITTCQEHCLTLKETAGTGRTLKLQKQIAKY